MDITKKEENRAGLDFNSAKIQRYNRYRQIKDSFARKAIAFGGIGVIAAILLIFMYLLYEVVPLFQSAKVNSVKSITLKQESPSLFLAVEEQNEIAFRLLKNGHYEFINLKSGLIVKQARIKLPSGTQITSFALNSDESRLFALGLNNGSVMLAKHDYKSTYPDGNRVISPELIYPYGSSAINLSLNQKAITSIAIKDSSESLTIIGTDGKQLFGEKLVKEEDFITESIILVNEPLTLPKVATDAGFKLDHLLLDNDQRLLFFQDRENGFSMLDLANGQIQTELLDSSLSSMTFLLGDISLLTISHEGIITQWFPTKSQDGIKLQAVRNFDFGLTSASFHLLPEHRRKAFYVVSEDGSLAIFHATAQREVFFDRTFIDQGKVKNSAISPRADQFIVEVDGQLAIYKVKNKHPEISWSSLWEKVWYESYDKPDYIWQSSSSDNDFEPKMSLMPLAFGTLKAAFYAMLLGAPLAIFGAIYTAYFMSPFMRRKIKPMIELMEALPTVILGFLAGLWLAPFMEKQLASIFTILIWLPLSVLLFAFAASKLPTRIQNRINQGWHGFILIPFILLMVFLCLKVSPLIELWFFDGNMRQWLSNDLGIPFDQRNALVVGIAMGFAVIPTIFSIAEDAIFSVPKHLSYGSLALGATPWQTLVGVVLPTASPGIFSGLMIGLGRAVGETMIVLMATGNTPIMDVNIFEGMRTLAANLAVEMPETEVNSTHYRVLFLAAFVLFLFTFVVNTLAELVRQNLRKKYGSL